MNVIKTVQITKETKNIIKFLKTNGFLDDEDLAYDKKSYPFTYEEYVKAFEELEPLTRDYSYDFSNEFQDHRAYFIMGKIKFTWRLLIGQGAALQLIKSNEGFISFDESKNVIKLI